MKKHLNNLGLMFVLVGLLSAPILGYGLLVKYESSEEVLSETDKRVLDIEEDFNYNFKKVDLDKPFDDIEDTEEFDPANYVPAEADLFLD